MTAATARIAFDDTARELQMMELIRAIAGATLLALLAGCATTNLGTPGDPLERMNRATHRFNSSIDRAVLRPVAVGYREHVPQIVQTGMGNFLDNLAYTTTIANDLLQLKIKDTLIDLGRFAVNSTLGIGGILDPATHFGIPKNDEDFGQTLGRWGVPPGPYLVVPFLGPSTVRDAPSIYVDVQTDLRIGDYLDTNDRMGARRDIVREPAGGAPGIRLLVRDRLRPVRLHPQRVAAAARIPGEGRRCR